MLLVVVAWNFMEQHLSQVLSALQNGSRGNEAAGSSPASLKSRVQHMVVAVLLLVAGNKPSP
jgi:hypothetical protein